MSNRIHIAYNATTGEVLTSSNGNNLNRRVKRIERWNIEHGYGRGKWVFAHGNPATVWNGRLASKFAMPLPF